MPADYVAFSRNFLSHRWESLLLHSDAGPRVSVTSLVKAWSREVHCTKNMVHWDYFIFWVISKKFDSWTAPIITVSNWLYKKTDIVSAFMLMWLKIYTDVFLTANMSLSERFIAITALWTICAIISDRRFLYPVRGQRKNLYPRGFFFHQTTLGLLYERRCKDTLRRISNNFNKKIESYIVLHLLYPYCTFRDRTLFANPPLTQLTRAQPSYDRSCFADERLLIISLTCFCIVIVRSFLSHLLTVTHNVYVGPLIGRAYLDRSAVIRNTELTKTSGQNGVGGESFIGRTL